MRRSFLLRLSLVGNNVLTAYTDLFYPCHLVQPSDRGEYELPDAIDLLIQSGRTIDAIRLDGWRIDVGYPEDRDRAEERLDELADETHEENDDADGELSEEDAAVES